MDNKDCQRGLTASEIMMEFGKDDDSIRKCGACSHMVYENGIMSCRKVASQFGGNTNESVR